MLKGWLVLKKTSSFCYIPPSVLLFFQPLWATLAVNNLLLRIRNLFFESKRTTTLIQIKTYFSCCIVSGESSMSTDLPASYLRCPTKFWHIFKESLTSLQVSNLADEFFCLCGCTFAPKSLYRASCTFSDQRVFSFKSKPL